MQLMAVGSMNLAFVFSAKDTASPQIAKINSGMMNMQKSAGQTIKDTAKLDMHLKDLGHGMAIMGAGIALGGVFKGAIDEGIKFQEIIGKVSTISDEALFPLQQISEESLKLATQYGGSPIDQATGFYDAIGAGFMDAKGATDMLVMANQLAVGANTDVGQSVNLLTSALNSFSSTGLTAKDASDALFATVAIGKTSVPELNLYLADISMTAASAGVSFDELGGAIAVLTAKGLRTGPAITGLKAAISNVAKPTKDAVDEAKRLGIEFNETALKTMGLQKFMKSLSSSSKYTEESLTKLFGSVEAKNAVLGLVAEGGAKFDEAMVSMGKKAGATEEAFRKMERTTAFQIKKMQGLTSVIKITIWEALEPMIASVMKFANTVLEKFNALPKPVKTFMTQVAAGTAAVLALGGALITAKAALGWLRISGLLGNVAFTGFLKTILRFVPVLGVIIGAVQLFRYLWDNNIGGIADTITSLWDTVSTFFSGLKQLLTQGYLSGDTLHKVWSNPALSSALHTVWRLIYRVQKFWQGVVLGFQGTMDMARPAFNALVDAFGKLFNAISKLFGGADDTAKAISLIPSSKFLMWGVAVGEMLGDIVVALVEVTTWLIDKLAVGIEYVGKAIEFVTPYLVMLKDAFWDAYDVVVAWGTSVYEWVTKSGGALDRVSALFSSFWGLIKRNALVAWEFLKGIVGGIGQAFTDAAPLWQPIIDMAKSLGVEIMALAGEVWGFVSMVWERGIPMLTRFYETMAIIWDYVSVVALPIIKGLGAVLGWIAGHVLNAILIPAFGFLITGLRGVVLWARLMVARFRIIGEAGIAMVNGLLDAGAAVWKFFSETVPNAFLAAWEGVKSTFQGIVNWFGRQTDAMLISVGDMLAQLPESFRPAWAEDLIKESDKALGRVEDYQAAQALMSKSTFGFSEKQANQAYEIAQKENITVQDAAQYMLNPKGFELPSQKAAKVAEEYTATAAGVGSAVSKYLSTIAATEERNKQDAGNRVVEQASSLGGKASEFLSNIAAEEARAKQERVDEQNQAIIDAVAKTGLGEKLLNVRSVLVVDGKVLAEASEKAKVEDQTRSFATGAGFMEAPP